MRVRILREEQIGENRPRKWEDAWLLALVPPRTCRVATLYYGHPQDVTCDALVVGDGTGAFELLPLTRLYTRGEA